ncbi:uncharacterized protein LOC126355765 [Schistocerca gregaria]|uniref:uncharacterized protein LOC126355765 n=1 Tax=Schistocerca gregaria TaxID=7010 RepID=UPI00211E5DD2|nr:uncharacterized protein LOC126355765 [Schistocerca gregaria]
MRLWIAVLCGATLFNVVLSTAIPTTPVEATVVKIDPPGEFISESGQNENELATGSEMDSLASAAVGGRSSGDAHDCGGDLDCEEGKLVAMIDKAESKESIPVIPGLVTLDKKVADKDDDDSNIAPEEGSQDIEVRLDRYLRSHALSLHVWGTKFQMDLERFSSRSQDVAQGRVRLRKLLLPILLLVKDLPLVVLGVVFSSAVVLISFHALWSGLASLIVSGWVGLKLLLQQAQPPSPRVSVGVVRAPLPLDVLHHDYLHHGHGWSRAGAAPVSAAAAAASPLVDPYRAYYQRGALERDYLDRPMRR